MEQNFELNIDEQTFKFNLDKHGIVWLIESNESGTNNGQTRPVKSLDEAKEVAKLMLYAMGRVRKK